MAQLGDLLDLDCQDHHRRELRDVVTPPRKCRTGCHPRAEKSDQAGRRDGGAAWQSRAARRRDKHSRRARNCCSTPRPWLFDSVEDMTLRVDSPDLDVTADDVLVPAQAAVPRPRRGCRKPAICRSR